MSGVCHRSSIGYQRCKADSAAMPYPASTSRVIRSASPAAVSAPPPPPAAPPTLRRWLPLAGAFAAGAGLAALARKRRHA